MSDRRSVALSLSLFVLVATACRPAPQIPLPDLTDAEPEVIRKVEQTRAEVERAPRSARVWGELGHRYRAGLWLAEAAACYREAERLEPTEFRWPYLLGHTLMHWDPPGAIEALARAIEIDPSYAPAHVVYAQRLVRLGRDTEARREYERALEIDPRLSHALTGLGQLALAAGDHAGARDKLERSLALEPDEGDTRRALAQTLLALGDREGAREQSRLAEELSYRSALVDPRSQSTVEPAGSVAYHDAGRARLERGDLEGAITAFQKALASDPDSSPAHYSLAVALTRSGRFDEALRHLREVERIQPGSTHYWNAMGQLEAERGRTALAAELWTKSLERNPDDAAIHHALGDLLAQDGRPREAEMHLRESLRLSPGRVQARFSLGALLNGQGRAAEAAEQLREAVRIAPDDAGIRFYLGTLLARERLEPEAATHLTQAVRLDPENPDVRVNFGRVLLKLGRSVEAAEQFGAALRLKPGDARAVQGLAEASDRP